MNCIIAINGNWSLFKGDDLIESGNFILPMLNQLKEKHNLEDIEFEYFITEWFNIIPTVVDGDIVSYEFKKR